MIKLLSIAILLIGITSVTFGQEASNPCRKSTEGTDFWFGFMEGRWDRNEGNNHYLEITVTARDTTTFTITIGSNEDPFQGIFTVNTNDRIQIRIPSTLVEPKGSEIIENKGIHLVSEKPVNVYALNFDNSSADVALIYPVQSLGTEHFALCYTPDVNGTTGRNSEFLIVASEDSTIIEITPSVKTDQNQPKDSTFSVTLNKGQVYQVQSMNQANLSGQGDLTGSYIASNKPVAFYSGSHGTRIPSGYCCWDHLYEQIPPVHSWGREYFTVPLKSREQDRYRILAAEDDTKIQITGNPTVTLNKGEHHEFVLYHYQPSKILADKPILVAQFSQSRDVDKPFTSGNGDPFMIILSSITQVKNDVTFVAYTTNITSYYVNIISLTSQINNIHFNGSPIASEFTPFPESEYSYAQKAINPGTYRINNTDPNRGFLAYVYGYSGVESLGYGVGFNLDLVLDLGESINFNGDTLLLCNGETVTLDAGPYFDTYNWNTGDSTQTLTVSKDGKYHVQTTTIDGCQLEDSIYVYLSHPVVDLGIEHKEDCSPYSIELDGNDGFEKYVWQNQNNDTLSTSQFYTADKTDEYRVTVFDEFQCPARDTMNLVVFPVPTIEISGEQLLCGTKTSTLSASFTGAPESVWNYPGSYKWTSNNPELTFTNDSHVATTITATDWGTYEIYYELTTSDACITGDTFLVAFQPRPTSEFIFEDDARCEGYSKKLIYTGEATSDAIFYWDLDGCHFVDTLGFQTYNVSVGAFLDTQPYIKLAIEDNQCWSDTTIRPLGAKPNFKMTADNLRGCDSLSPIFNCELLTDDVVEYLWSFGDGTTQTISNPIKHYPDTGFFDVSLVITNPITQCENGFTYEDMVKVFLTPTADITVDSSICYPDSAELVYTHNIDSSFCTWNFEGAHQSGIGNDSIIMILDEPFSKAILTVNEYGCVSPPDEITLKRKPDFDFTTDFQEGCQPLALEVYAEPNDDFLNFTWLSDSIPHPTGNSNLFLFPDSGKVDIGVIANSMETGCSDTLIKADWIWVHPKPVADFEVDYPVALIEHATITYTNLSEFATQYYWDFGNSETSTEFNPIHTFTQLGEFNSQLFIESSFGCKDTTEFLIKILPFNVYTPNAFRPDSDFPENTTFMPVGVGADPSNFNIKIYDRWGQIMYETNSPESPWDGTTKNGKNAPMGNYVWISNYLDIQGFVHNQKGQILLVR